ncbi:MAG: transposase [Candidatus Acidiferrales bacterium]
MSANTPSRRSIRLGGCDYSLAAAYFFTICAVNRQSIFGRIVGDKMECNRAGDAVCSAWREVPLRFPTIQLDTFVVMPNHVHGVLFLLRPNTSGAASGAPTKIARNMPTVSLILRAFKSLSAAAVNHLLDRSGSVWQRNYYEHIVRSGKDLDAIRLYIDQNPQQWRE